MNTSKFLRFVLISLVLLLTACGPAAAVPPTAASQPAALPQPSATTPPTAAPAPTNPPTAAPTSTTAATATTAPTATQQPTATSLPPLMTPGPGQIVALDMKAVDGRLNGGIGHGFFYGNYIYFVPWNDDIVVRLDRANFTKAGASVVKLSAGFVAGSFSDGRYGYFPNAGGEVTRLDLQSYSEKGLTWTNFNPDLGGGGLDVHVGGGFSDGKYAYLSKVGNGRNSGLLRVSLTNFKPGSSEFLNISNIDNTTYLYGGITDGRYAYFASDESAIELQSNGASSLVYSKIVRVDLQNFTPSGVTVLDLATVDANMLVVNGWFLNGGYLYLAPNQNGKITRIDTKNFTTAGVTNLDLSAIDKALFGYVTAFSDGKYGYFLPNWVGKNGDTERGSGKIARIDLSNFSKDGLTWLDLTRLDKNWNNFMDGMSDGKYLYLEPGDWAPAGSELNTSVVRVSLDYAGWTK